jgi:hypothetical protein
MAVTTTFYNRVKYQQLGDTSVTPIDFKADTIKVSLHTSSYTPDIDAHDFYDDITNEISATGYTTGGETLGTKVTSQDNTDDEGVFDAADVVWTITTSATARYAVIYKSTGTASTSPLVAYINFGEDLSVANGTFTITWNAEGVININ